MSPISKRIAKIAHAHGVPLIVDNTVATPYLLRPIDFGADIVVQSLTKYLGGHGNSLGGAIIDSQVPVGGHKARFPRLNEPDVSYHGVVYTEALGPVAYIGRARVVPLRNTGAALSPFNSFLILQGIETLPYAWTGSCRTRAPSPNISRRIRRSLCQLRRPAGSPRTRAGAEIPARCGAFGLFTFGLPGGRKPARASSMRCNCSRPGQYRRYPLAGHASARPRTASWMRRNWKGRRDAGHRAAVDRHRARRRSDHRSGTGVGGGLSRGWWRALFPAPQIRTVRQNTATAGDGVMGSHSRMQRCLPGLHDASCPSRSGGYGDTVKSALRHGCFALAGRHGGDHGKSWRALFPALRDPSHAAFPPAYRTEPAAPVDGSDAGAGDLRAGAGLLAGSAAIIFDSIYDMTDARMTFLALLVANLIRSSTSGDAAGGGWLSASRWASGIWSRSCWG